jgi:hypothetical protein
MSDLVDEEVIRARCVDQHESPIFQDVLDGRGGRGWYGSFEASVTNKSRNFVITRLRITLTLPGEPDRIQTQEIRGQWIVPSQKTSIYATDIKLSEEDYAAMTKSQDDPYGWSISDVYGVEIDVN